MPADIRSNDALLARVQSVFARFSSADLMSRKQVPP
eukprot:SAG22_NODE_293_length_12891_cov_17.337242_5_plen_36_part_00